MKEPITTVGLKDHQDVLPQTYLRQLSSFLVNLNDRSSQMRDSVQDDLFTKRMEYEGKNNNFLDRLYIEYLETVSETGLV